MLIFKMSLPLQAQAPDGHAAAWQVVHICRFQHWKRQREAEVVRYGDQPQQVHRHSAQVEISIHRKRVRLPDWCCSQRHPPILQRHEEEHQHRGRLQTVGDQPAARQPHRVCRSRCIRHVQGTEHDRLHHRCFGICKRAGGCELLWPTLLPLCGMKIHQSLPSFYFRLCLPFILLFQISSLLLLGWTSMIMSCLSWLNKFIYVIKYNVLLISLYKFGSFVCC